MDLQSILVEIQSQKIAPTRHLIDRCYWLADIYKEHPAFSDEKYLPFYYHLGKYISPSNVLNLDFDSGVKDLCFLTNCKSVNNYVGICSYSDLIEKLGRYNVRLVYEKDINIYKNILEAVESNHWDLVFSENVDTVLKYSKDVWQKMSQDGLLIIDRSYDKQSDIESLSKLINRESYYVEGRYGINIFVK